MAANVHNKSDFCGAFDKTKKELKFCFNSHFEETLDGCR